MLKAWSWGWRVEVGGADVEGKGGGEMRELRAVIDAQGDVAIFTLFVSRDAPACAVPAPAPLNPFFFPVNTRCSYCD